MKFTDNMVQQSQDARDQVIGLLEEAKRKAFLQEVLGEIQFIGDEIPRPELERLFDIDKRTASRFINSNKEELEDHGYRVVRGKEALKSLVEAMDTDVHRLLKPTDTNLGLFTIDAALSFGMVLTESEPAKRLRSALIELTKEATPEQLFNAVVRALELGDFRKTWSLFASLPGFRQTDARAVHGKILLAVTGMSSTEIKESRKQVRQGDKRTARNYLTDKELFDAASLEKAIYYATMNSSNFREAFVVAEAIVDNAVRLIA